MGRGAGTDHVQWRNKPLAPRQETRMRIAGYNSKRRRKKKMRGREKGGAGRKKKKKKNEKEKRSAVKKNRQRTDQLSRRIILSRLRETWSSLTQFHLTSLLHPSVLRSMHDRHQMLFAELDCNCRYVAGWSFWACLGAEMKQPASLDSG